ncbi:hypothetical protein CHS0354_037245 [Potamilus streckersoni]|uniref:Uncharacterized protein n=1 Tax=Potamilus streckersoni TaxID=2493646 RepID=A0AAE0SXL1_9BIVA|nr:hypothetical protein CHS0354_037245 [Potamilus streckersoni]
MKFVSTRDAFKKDELIRRATEASLSKQPDISEVSSDLQKKDKGLLGLVEEGKKKATTQITEKIGDEVVVKF